MIESVLEFGIGNALVASLLSLVVFGITRVWRNPYLVHMLWLFVLIKLVTPPIWHITIPISTLREVAPQSLDEHHTPGVAEQPTPFLMNGEPSPTYASLGELWMPSWQSLLLTIWGVGSVICASTIIFRVIRFNHGIKATIRADHELEQTAEVIMKQVGLLRMPTIRLSGATISPLVWPVAWRPVVVLPLGLVRDVNEAVLATIIGHEFVHLRRRDHWVRFLEAVVNSLYWWNPVIWWVQRQLHAAEEACCDADVLHLFPANAADYGEALLRTGKFMSSAGCETAPALSNGFNTSICLKGRIEMVLENRMGRPISRSHRWSLIAIAICVAPITARATPANEDFNGTDPARFQSLENRISRIEILLEKLLQHAEADVFPKDKRGDPQAIWQPFSTETVAAHLKKGQPVIVHFRADWCPSSALQRQTILESAAVQQAMRLNNVAALDADYTNRSPHVQAGLISINQSTVPVLAIYDPSSPAAPTVFTGNASKAAVVSALQGVATSDSRRHGSKRVAR